MMINIPKGTKDALPQDSYGFLTIEQKAREVAKLFNLNEIRTPTFEHTELFLRGVGDTTDVVGKEMYTFLDKGERSITLKPEGTAGVARAYIESGMDRNASLPVKMYYITPVFRYERPQSGRLREHHQFGVELYGSPSAETDAEVIQIAKTLMESVGIKGAELFINSIGCPECRKKYNSALKEFIAGNLDKMCKDCKERFDKNPLRLLDCKEENCKKLNAGAPAILDYLCDDCKEHFEALKNCLSESGINFSVNPRIVRGLDYYTRTVFEFINNGLTVCGGGRYDNLVSLLGGNPTPAVGFGMGLERLLMIADAEGADLGKPNTPDIYVANLSDSEKSAVRKLVYSLRRAGISAECDLMSRSLKAQMKYAGRIGAKFVTVIGDSELSSGECLLKRMADGETTQIKLDELVNTLKEKM
ncbi:MAG: histidine--tRNA ligase [Clostridia bacterium]|nr:histidine--tRNA ligase [Clostridia bacterium]